MTAEVPHHIDVQTAQHPLSLPRSARNPITWILHWASQTDPNVIPLCGWWTRQTQASLGFFVLFTATIAGFSSYYTLATLNVPPPFTLVLAFLWSMFAQFCDRFVVASLDNHAAMIRPVLALFIGLLVAVPVELWVFQDRVDQEIDKVYRADNAEAQRTLEDGQKEIVARRTALQHRYESLLAEEKQWGDAMDSELVGRSGEGRTGLRGEGPVYENAAHQQARVHRLITEVRRDLDDFNQTNRVDYDRLEGHFHRQEVRKSTSFPVRYEALHSVLTASAPLYWLSWIVTLFFILVEMCPTLMKMLTANTDYHHIVTADMNENIVRIDAVAEENLRIAMHNPTEPEPSIVEKYGFIRFGI